ncbi:MAG: response regulator [Candidatus Poribacteria bacterium]|nr:response regulator [Candidatus Poribacteria bacterium]
MRILIAEDDDTSRLLLKAMLDKWEYDVTVAHDGAEAWQVLQQEDTPRLAILDWMMPKMDGVEVCRKVREINHGQLIYILLLTTRGRTTDIIEGLEAGADDYLTKPFNQRELQVRVRVGERVVKLQSDLANRVNELEDALSQVKQLEGLLPICAYCKKVRDDHDFWHQVENYIMAYSEARFSHSICPDCYEQIIVPQLEALQRQKKSAH